MFYSFPYFAPKLFVSLSSGCWCILLLFAGRIFFCCFAMSSFVCIVLSYLDIFLVFLLSPVPSGLFSQVVLGFFICWVNIFFSSQYIPAFLFCLIIFAYCRRSLIYVSSQISHPGFEFLFMFLGEHRFYHKLISLRKKQVRLIPWCFSLRCGLIIRLFFQFLPWLFSSLGFLAMVI